MFNATHNGDCTMTHDTPTLGNAAETSAILIDALVATDCLIGPRGAAPLSHETAVRVAHILCANCGLGFRPEYFIA